MSDNALPGILVVLSGPSGVGKTTIARRLLEKPGYVRSISVTTRPKRPGEVDGKDYRFISQQEFERLRQSDELLEWAEVHGYFYGTPKEPLREALRLNQAFLLVIDVQGGAQIRSQGLDSLLLFLTAPDARELARRLSQRGTEPPSQQTVRLERASQEERKAAEIYDRIVVNKDLARCVDEVDGLVRQSRERLNERQEAGEVLYPGLEL
jgi:guanylate kinase